MVFPLRLFGVCVGLALGLSLSPAWAQSSTPAMAGVTEMQVQPGRMGNKSASDACGLSGGEIAAQTLELMKAAQLPATSIMESTQRQGAEPGSFRIEIQPEIVTMNPQGVDCTSWVALFAQTRSSVVVPPSRMPRNVAVTYWRGGLMVSSTQISHPRAMKEALEKLVGQLARQYRLDQPPALPDLSS